GAMAQTEVGGQVVVFADGLHTTRGLDPSFVYDDGAVVQRAGLVENRKQQTLVYVCIDRIAGLRVKLQPRVAREHDQRSRSRRHERLDRIHDLTYIEVVDMTMTPMRYGLEKVFTEFSTSS